VEKLQQAVPVKMAGSLQDLMKFAILTAATQMMIQWETGASLRQSAQQTQGEEIGITVKLSTKSVQWIWREKTSHVLLMTAWIHANQATRSNGLLK